MSRKTNPEAERESDEEEFLSALSMLLEDRFYEVRSFDSDGVLTGNNGFVVRLRNGAEFQVRVVQSQDAYKGQRR